jgi:hypothetical protein
VEGIKIPIGAPLGQLDSDLKGAQSKLKAFATSAASTAGTLGGSVAKGANQAGFALQNLGRVAQDAPFGFIGIQNNIQPLLESFQRLKAESGSTGGAIKALGASLVGGGGLLLAVSLVTSALTVLAQNPEKVAGALNYLSGAVDDATVTQKAYNAALIENVADANTEITTIQSLIKVAQDENLSRNARLEALKKVKAEYPEQLEFLNLENINSIKAAKAIDILTNSLIRKAKIQAAEKLIGEAFVKQLEATTKSAVEQASTFSKIVGASLGAAGIKNFVVLQDGLENQQKAFKEAGQEVTTYTNLLQKLLADDAKAGTLFDDAKGGNKKSSAPKFDRGAIFSEAKMVGVTMGVGLQAGFQTVQPILAEQFELLNKQFIDWNRNISDIVNNGLVQTLGGIGEAIGQSLASGSSIAQNLGATLLASLGSVLGQLGQMAIATGVALLGIQTALKTLNPFAAIAAGVALLALSGIVRGGASRLSGGFSGGGGGGGYSAASPSGGVSPVSSSGGMGGGFSGAELVARVSGSDLLLVINRAQAKNRRFGP